MRLVTLNNGTPDGRLMLVSPDGLACTDAPAETMQHALEGWEDFVASALKVSDYSTPLAVQNALAPLPRSWQWLDGSAYASHGELMDKVLGLNAPKHERPLMYQGVSSKFYAPTDDVPLPDEAHGIDFEVSSV